MQTMTPARFIGWVLALASLPATAANASDLSAEIGLVSDYRYRGLSLTDGKPAVQGSATFEHDSGLYAEAWSSTIGGPDVGADVELDFTAGYSLDITDNLNLDMSGTYYLYPGEPGANYVDGTISLEITQGRAAARLGLSFAPKQKGTEDDEGKRSSNSYAFAGASYELENLPLTLNAELGHERGAFDEAPSGGKWDWQLGADLKLEPARIGLGYVGSDIGDDALVASLSLEL
jgi:uncharacterized protein (TIGR02001 family)